MKRLILSISLLSFLGLNAQNDRMTPQLLWELGRVSFDDVSSDGKQLIYGVTRYNIEANKGNRDLYLMNTDGSGMKQLTNADGGEYGGVFLMGGKKIGYMKGGQLMVMEKGADEAKAVTNISGGMGGVNVYELKDGKIALLFTKAEKLDKTTLELYPNLPKAEALITDDLMYRHWDGWSDDSYNHVCIAYLNDDLSPVTDYTDLMRGERFDSPLNPFGGSESYTLSPDGKTVVYEAKKKNGLEWAVSTNSELYMVDLATGKTTNLTAEGFDGYDKEPKFSPDGKKLAWLSMAKEGYESDVNDLIIMDLKTGKRSHYLTDAGLYDKMTFHSYSWAGNKSIYAGVPENGTNQIYRLSLPKKIGGTLKNNLEKVTNGHHNHNHFAVAGKKLIVERQDMNHATEVFSVNLKNSAATQLTHINDEIYSGIKLSKVEARQIPTSDGKTMHTWVIYPPDFDPNKKYPALLYCQGGPQSQVSQFYSFRWNFQLMAAQGYIVVAPNRRGLPGFGKKWNEDISGDWGGQPMKDYLAAIDAVKEESYVDENRLGSVGASYGGYSVYWLAGNHNKRFKAFISHCGLFDLESWYLSTEELFFANQDLGGPFWKSENMAGYQKFDPKDYVQNWDTPILVIHGGNDFRVPENQGMQAFQAAKLRGIPTRFLYFPNEGHWILSPQNGLIWHDQFFGWLNQWLQ